MAIRRRIDPEQGRRALEMWVAQGAADGAPADVDSMSMDVTSFLMWAAEPHLMDRKQVGFISVLFLIVLTVLLYLTNKRLWWPLKHGRDRLNDGR